MFLGFRRITQNQKRSENFFLHKLLESILRVILSQTWGILGEKWRLGVVLKSKNEKIKNRLNNSMSDISEITTFFFSKILLKCFPIEFFKYFNGFQKINKYKSEVSDQNWQFMPTKGSFAGSKFKKRIFFELFWGKSWSKEPPVAEKGLWLLKKKIFLLVSQFKKLSFKSSPVKKFESQGQKTPKFWTSAVVHYHLLKAWKSQLWATRAFFFQFKLNKISTKNK